MSLRCLLQLAVVAALAACATEPGAGAGDSCMACHQQQAEDWRHSAHARAATTPAFVATVKAARFPDWCIGCHAPTGDPAVGVACRSCHGGHTRPTAAVCARCHEFKQPRRDVDTFTPGPHPAQRTVSEWRNSHAAAAGQTCVDCHLDKRRGGHAFPVRRGEGVVVDATRIDDVTVAVGITLTAIGHNLPTGDPFRHLELRLCADAECKSPVARRRFGQRVEARPDGFAVVADTTLAPPVDGPTRRHEFVIALAEGAPLPTTFALILHLVEPALAPSLPASARAVVLASGVVGPPPP